MPGSEGVRLSTEVAREILSAVNGLSYGSVEITVHESRVVQIERRERVRLEGARTQPANEPHMRIRPKPSTDGDLTTS
jgi:hypothetical protein